VEYLSQEQYNNSINDNRTREERSALEKKNRRILRKSFDELRKHLEVKGGRVAVLNACKFINFVFELTQYIFKNFGL